MADATKTFTATCQTHVAVSPAVAFAAWSDPRLLETWMAFKESGGADKPRLIGHARGVGDLPGAVSGSDDDRGHCGCQADGRVAEAPTRPAERVRDLVEP